jgi:TonB family protein
MTPHCERQLLLGLAAVILAPVLALYASEPSSTPQTPPETLATHVLDARVHALKQNKPDAGFEEVERRLTRLYNNSSSEADEAVVILMSFYLGEHNGEELYENLLSRGPRMIPIIERYLHERPAIAARYPKELQLDRNTTVMYLGESLEILKVQAGARHISKMLVETAPLRQQSDSCKPRLVHRPHINFPDNLIRTGETYRSTPVLRMDIEEGGGITNAEVIQDSGIKRLDALLLQNVKQWKFAARPGCGVVQSNVAITIDWTAAH